MRRAQQRWFAPIPGCVLLLAIALPLAPGCATIAGLEDVPGPEQGGDAAAPTGGGGEDAAASEDSAPVGVNEGSEASVEDSSSGPSPEGGAGADASPGGSVNCAGGSVGASCSPQPLGSCVPGYNPPANNKGSCTSTDVTTFFNDCLSVTPPQTPICDGSDLSSEACFNCLASQPSNATWGAVILYSSAWWLNLGGCYALIGATAACATAVQEQAECEAAACSNTCSTASNSEGQACLASADGTVCSAYTTSISTNCPSTITTAAACGATTNAANPELAQYQAVASTFCE
ncbi:MAG: hypothetical protein ACLQBL_09560 [Polyangiaceae bacterium]